MPSEDPTLENTPLDEMTLFDCLSSTQHIPQFQYLLQSGNTPDITDDMGVSLLYRAVLTEQFNFVQLLLEYQADPLFVYDPIVYNQFQRFESVEQSNVSSSLNLQPTTTTSSQLKQNKTQLVPSIQKKKVLSLHSGLVQLLMNESIQPPMSDFEPLLFISSHFKTRKIFDALLKSMTFEQVLLIRNSLGQSIFEYVAFECSEHMVMDSLFRYLRMRLSKLTKDTMNTIKPAIPPQYWPVDLLNASEQPKTPVQAFPNDGLPSPSSVSTSSPMKSGDAQSMIRFMSNYFIPHAVLHGLTAFVKLYLTNGADANGYITPYSLGIILPSPDRTDLSNPVNTYLIGKNSSLCDKINTAMFTQLIPSPSASSDPIPFQYTSTLTVEFEFEPYIIVAAHCGFEFILKELLLSGADVNVGSNRVSTEYNNQHLNVLSTAFFQGHFKLCRSLIFPPKDFEQNKNNQKKSPGITGDDSVPVTHTIIYTGQLDQILTQNIKRFTDPVALTRVDQFITFRYQQYIQEKREEYNQKQQHQQSGRLKGFFKGLVDATKQTLHDFTTEDGTEHNQLQASPVMTQSSANSGILATQVVSPVSELIAYQNTLTHTASQTAGQSTYSANTATQSTYSTDATPQPTVTTILPLPHHIPSLCHLLLTKPSNEGLADHSRNVDFIQRIYLEALFLSFCEIHNVLMIKAILLLSLQYSKYINEYKKQALRFKNERLLTKALEKKTLLAIDQNIVNDETGVQEDDIIAFTSNLVHVSRDDDDSGDNNTSSDKSPASNSPQQTTKKLRTGSTVDSTGTSGAAVRRTSALPPDSSPHPGKGGLEQRNVLQMSELDFVLPNLKLVNAINPHNDYTPIHYAILHQDIDLLQFFLTFQPQLLVQNTTKHALGVMQFAHLLQSQLRQDLNAQLQDQYTAKLHELKLINGDASQGGYQIGLNNTSTCAAVRGSLAMLTPMANQGHGAAFRAEVEKGEKNIPSTGPVSTKSTPTSTSASLSNSKSYILPIGLDLQVDWEIVDGEQDMGEDDFTVLDDDFAESVAQPRVSLRQAFSATKKATQNASQSASAKASPFGSSRHLDGMKNDEKKNTAGNNSLIKSKPLGASTHIPEIDPLMSTSFDLIPDLNQINSALGNDNNGDFDATKNSSSKNVSKNNQNFANQRSNSTMFNDFTLVEPILEMESPSHGSNSTPNPQFVFSQNKTAPNSSQQLAPARPSRPQRPVASPKGNQTDAINPSSATSMSPPASQRTLGLGQGSQSVPMSTAQISRSNGAFSQQQGLSQLQLADSDDDDDGFTVTTRQSQNMPANQTGLNGSNRTSGISAPFKRPFFIEIGVLLEYLYQLYKAKQLQNKLNNALLSQSNHTHVASLFGTNMTSNQTGSPDGNDIHDHSHDKPLYLILRRILPSNFTIKLSQQKQLEFLNAFLVNSNELVHVLDKITKLAQCIDLVGYFISVLIAPLSTTVDTSNSTQFLDTFVPLESSVSRFGGLGLNAKFEKITAKSTPLTKKGPNGKDNKSAAPHRIFPTLATFYRYKKHLSKSRCDNEDGAPVSTGVLIPSSSLSPPHSPTSLSATSCGLNENHSLHSFFAESTSSSSSTDSLISPLQEQDNNQKAAALPHAEDPAFNFQDPPKSARRNSHFEIIARTIDQMKADVNASNAGTSSPDENVGNRIKVDQDLIKSQIDTLDGNMHLNDDKKCDKNNTIFTSSKDKGLNPASSPTASQSGEKITNRGDSGTCRQRTHQQRRVDIVFDELLHGASNGSVSAASNKKKKASSALMLGDDDVGGTYKFSFSEKHRLLLVQLTNEQMNAEDQALIQRFAKKTREMASMLSKLQAASSAEANANNNSSDSNTSTHGVSVDEDGNEIYHYYDTYEKKIARLYHLMGRYINDGIYPNPDELVEIDFDEITKSGAGNKNGQNGQNGKSNSASSLSPLGSLQTLNENAPSGSSITLTTSVPSSIQPTLNSNATNENKKKSKQIKWADQFPTQQ